MVRVLWLGDDPSAAVSDGSVEGPLYHADPSHASFQLLQQSGIAVQSLPAAGIDRGTILMPGPAGEPRRGPLYDLVYIVDRLLGPGGCPWDREQTHESLKKYLLEEAYEVLDAIDSGSSDKLREELGDLLLQPLMHTQMRRLTGDFDIDDVAREISDKLVRRHPHVFGDASADDPETVLRNWDRIKQSERGNEPRSLLDGVPKGMASLLRAHEVSKRAARAGFEWPDIEAVFDKLHEEERELREALQSGDAAHVESEVGDLLFTAVNVARWAKVEPEEALRKMLNRFTERFQSMERASDKPLAELSPGEWDELWEESKRASRPKS